MHRGHAAERAVINFKNYSITALWIVDPHFFFYLWNHLLPQFNMTLNMLRRSELKSYISAYEQVDGIQIFERTLLEPLGCKVQIHKKNHKRLTYAPHSVDVWYRGPEYYHYICYTCYSIDTEGETTPDKIYFFPAFMKMYNNSSRDMAIHADADLKKSSKTPRPESPFQVGDSQLKAIR